MARLVGVDIPDNKPIGIALTYVHGIGRTTAAKILADNSIDPGVRTKALSEGDFTKILKTIEKSYQVEGDRRRIVNNNIKLLKDIGCYRGLRHRRGLPVRGQRTSTNARTRKGPRKTIANKKKATK